MQKRFSINLDLLSFSLLNFLFFLCFFVIFQDPSTFTTKTCSELPKPSQMIEYMHLAIFAIFMIAFVMKSCMFTLENDDKCVIKAMKCVINLSLFMSFFAFNVFLMNLFYIYFKKDEDCLILNKIVLSDIIVMSIGYGVLLIYRLCCKAMLNEGIEGNWKKNGNAMHLSQKAKKNNGKKGRYGTMAAFEEDF